MDGRAGKKETVDKDNGEGRKVEEEHQKRKKKKAGKEVVIHTWDKKEKKKTWKGYIYV